MVSITIGLILMAGVLSIFLSSRVTYFANERTARLQENGRVALDLVTHDVRSAGYQGCARGVPVNNRLVTPTSTNWNYIFPVQGYEYRHGHLDARVRGRHLSPAPSDSDVIVVRADRMASLDACSDLRVLNAIDLVMTPDGPSWHDHAHQRLQRGGYLRGHRVRAGAPATSVRGLGGPTPGNATADLG